MKVSIKQAMKNVSSEGYDKTNIFYYILISSLVCILSSFVPEKPTMEQLPLVLIAAIVIFCFSFLMNGIYTLATHNAICGNLGVFPNPIKDLSKILMSSLFAFVGNLVWIIAMVAVTLLFMVPLMFVNKIAAVLVSAIPLLFVATIFIGAYFNFYHSLEIEEWFRIKKALAFFKEAKSYILPYFIRTVFLGIIWGVLFVGIAILLYPLSMMSEAATSVTAGLVELLATIVYCIISIYIVDITAQFVRAAKQRSIVE